MDEATELATKGMQQLQMETQAAKKVTTSLKVSVVTIVLDWLGRIACCKLDEAVELATMVMHQL